jgi:hypothetical protein
LTDGPAIEKAETRTRKKMDIHQFMKEFEMVAGDGWRETDQNHRESKRNHNSSGAYHWPANITTARLLTNWETKAYTEVDFTGDTYEMAMRRIIRFYKKMKNRRHLGDHLFIEGFDEIDGNLVIHLGS